MIAAVMRIFFPIHLDLIPVVIGVQIRNSELISEVSESIVYRDRTITHRGRRAVENKYDAFAAAKFYGFLQDSYIVLVYPVTLGAVPVVVFAAGVTVVTVIYQKTFKVVSYAARLPVFKPYIMKAQKGKFCLKAF